MKKLLGVLLAITMSWPVSAAVLQNVEVVGEIQTIASDVNHQLNYTTGIPPALRTHDVYNRMAWTRAMAGLSADLVEDVTANILFQYAYAWGQNNEEMQGFSNAKDVKLVNANVTLHNLFCAFDVTVGRQFYGDEDSAVMYFGPNHYNAEAGYFAKALDAAKLTYADDIKSLTLIAGTLYDAEDDDLSAKYDIYGADFKINILESLRAQVYGYDVKARGADRADEDMQELIPYLRDGKFTGYDEEHNGFYGAKLSFSPAMFRMSAEYARNFGGKRFLKEHKPTGHMFKADVAADLIDMLTARATFYYANEEFWAFGNYTPGLVVGHKLEGDMSAYSEQGVRMYNLGFDVKPFAKWTFAIDGYAFQGTHGPEGYPAGGNNGATWEADLTVKYAHNQYVELFAGVGYVKYGNDVTSIFAKEDYNTILDNARRDNVKGQLGMLIKF